MDHPPTTFRIIQASLEHIESVAPLFDAYRQFYGQPPDLDGARRFISERLAKQQSSLYLAFSVRDSTPLGFVHLYPSFSSVSMKRLWILNDLYVVPEARKQGVGEALMERARQWAVETRAKGLILETATDNLEAQRLYERLGYKKELEFFRYFLKV